MEKEDPIRPLIAAYTLPYSEKVYRPSYDDYINNFIYNYSNLVENPLNEILPLSPTVRLTEVNELHQMCNVFSYKPPVPYTATESIEGYLLKNMNAFLAFLRPRFRWRLFGLPFCLTEEVFRIASGGSTYYQLFCQKLLGNMYEEVLAISRFPGWSVCISKPVYVFLFLFLHCFFFSSSQIIDSHWLKRPI
jgi:hypothetical protein